MIYKDKIHSLDKYFLKWPINKKYILYGASKECAQFISSFLKIFKNQDIEIEFIIDDETKKKKVHDIYDINENTFKYYPDRKPVLKKIIEIKKFKYLKNIEHSKIIITSESRYNEYKKKLELLGLIEDENFTSYKKISAVWPLKILNKLHLWRSDILLTEKCTLNCTFCNMYMPHYKDPVDKDLDRLKNDLDIFFKNIDFVSIFHLVGGEPFLFKKIDDLINYVGTKYRNKIDHLTITTNGTLTPKENTLNLLKKYNILLSVSDYTDSIKYSRRLQILIKKLKSHQIKFAVRKAPKWIDFGDPRIEHKFTDEEMIEHFDKCTSPYRAIDNNKFYYCHMNTSAVRAKILKTNDKNNYINLKENPTKESILLFDLGFIPNGYISYCRRCNGCNTGIDIPVSVSDQGLRTNNKQINS